MIQCSIIHNHNILYTSWLLRGSFYPIVNKCCAVKAVDLSCRFKYCKETQGQWRTYIILRHFHSNNNHRNSTIFLYGSATSNSRTHCWHLSDFGRESCVQWINTYIFISICNFKWNFPLKVLRIEQKGWNHDKKQRCSWCMAYIEVSKSIFICRWYFLPVRAVFL